MASSELSSTGPSKTLLKIVQTPDYQAFPTRPEVATPSRKVWPIRLRVNRANAGCLVKRLPGYARA